MPAGKMYHRHYPKRKYRKKRVAHKKHAHKKRYHVAQGRLKSRNLQGVIETKKYEKNQVSTGFIVGSADPAVRPLGGTIVIPPAWSDGLVQGVDCNEIVGCSVTDRYISMKVRVNFNTATGGLFLGTETRYIQGWCKHTCADHDFDIANLTYQIYRDKVGTMLVNNKLGSDWLEYSQRWRNIEVIKSGYCRPITKMQQPQPVPMATGTLVSPDWTKEFKWSPKRKMLLHKQKDFAVTHEMTRFRSWIPFVIFYNPAFGSDELPAGEVPSFVVNSMVWYSDS